jgi:hypothetical protein
MLIRRQWVEAVSGKTFITINPSTGEVKELIKMHTSATDIVTTFMEALEIKEFDTANAYLSDTFQYIGSTPKPLNKQQYIRYSSELAEGMPNLSYNFHDVQEVEDELGEGNRMRAAIQITGTHTNAFQVIPLGLPLIPETNKSVSLPEEHWEYLIKDNTIATIDVEQVAGGGIAGILQQLGVDIPIIQ